MQRGSGPGGSCTRSLPHAKGALFYWSYQPSLPEAGEGGQEVWIPSHGKPPKGLEPL